MAAVFVYALCIYVSHTHYYGPAGFAVPTPRAKQLKLNILKGHSKRERKWWWWRWWCFSDTKGENNFKKSENPETDKHVNTLFVQFP